MMIKGVGTIFIYGPPGSGKSSLGKELAVQLDLSFIDLDECIQLRSGQTIPKIFTDQGEAGFRRLEREALLDLLDDPPGVLALGGGTLLDERNRAVVEAFGPVLCLLAPFEILQPRLQADAALRPLLQAQGQNTARLPDLLTERADHYASFSHQLDVSDLDLPGAAWQAQIGLGRFRLSGMGTAYPVLALPGGLQRLGKLMQGSGLKGPIALVSDSNVAAHYAQTALDSLAEAGYQADLVVISPGETHKTIETIQGLWQAFIKHDLERSSTVVALGGGVVGDLAGFAAAAYLRGVRWVTVPTSLLAMVDASLGGKTGADLPQGKNLVGAFHPPALVLADPQTLSSLPVAELRSGLAEVVKHGLIGDPLLFEQCGRGWEFVTSNLDEIVRRAMAVKIRIIQQDPYEQGLRAVLNLGHTLGHAVELVSQYQLRHGEAVAIGMLAAAHLSEGLGLAEPGLAERLAVVLSGLGLPVEFPAGLQREQLLAAIRVDKKRKGRQVRWVLPLRPGEVRSGVVIEDFERWIFPA